MPTYKIKAPNGKTYTVAGPAGATDEQVRAEVLRQHPDAAGKPKEKPTSFFQGVGEGLTKAGTNALQLLEKGPMGVPLKIAGGLIDYAQGATPSFSAGKSIQRNALTANAAMPTRGSTAGRITGEVLGSIPTLAMPGGALVQGAAGGVLLSDDINNPRQVATNALTGAVAGKAGDIVGRRVIAPAATRLGQGVKSAVQKTKPKATPIDDAVEHALAPLGRKAQARAARFESVGVKQPTTGMVTRDPAAWKAERELSKLDDAGAPLQEQILAVDRDLVDAGRSIVDNAGGSIGPEATGLRVQEALKAKSDEMQEVISGLYKGVREQVGDARVPSMENLKAAQAHPDWADNTQFDDMVSAVNKRLLRYADADGGAAGLNVKQAEELRKFIGGLGPNSSQTFAMRRVLQDALDADVIDNLGGAPFAEARAAAAARFGEFKGTFAGKVADEGLAPEKLAKRVLSEGTSLADLRALKKSLTTGTAAQTERGKAALQAMRGETLGDVINSGITPDGSINGTTIYKAFQKAAPKLRVLLDEDEYKAVRRFAYASRDATAQVPHSNVNNSNTASMIANLFPAKASAKQRGIFSQLMRQVSAWTVGGPTANVALLVGDNVAERMAGQRAAKAVGSQVDIASSPQSAATAIKQAEQAAIDEALRKRALERGQDLSGNALRLIGTAGAAQGQ